ncbi:MAG: hypothetical protein UZ21_OP11001000029 [Microgenomates bacterium OLB22]|nr:MAG: hypothetical protein UZ21_OP11001000029 [Microgenomates bacterium OLB22]
MGDFRHGVEAGANLIQAGKISVEAIAPYADLIGFKKDSGTSFLNKSAEERIQTAVLTLDKVLVKVDDIAVEVDAAREHIDKINPHRYPDSIGSRPVGTRIENLQKEFDSIAGLFVDAKPFLKQLPSILGADKEKTYIVLFQNDKELRPTGGFLTAYAIFRVNQGRIKVERSADIYSLDDAIKVHPAAPREILTYHKGVSKLFVRDSNLSPDYPTSVKYFDDLYQQAANKVPYDGIFTMDTHVLVDTLRILGDTEVRGTIFSARQDARCDCPQVIYKLLDEIDRPVAYLKADRKGILGDLLFAIMQKALGFSPSQYWGPLVQDMLKNLQEKHILVNLNEPGAQESIEKLNYAGRIQPFDGDYLHINDTNFAGAKSNLYVQHAVDSKTTIAPDGTVKRELVITYKNPKPHSNCNLEDGGGLGRGGLCINATLRNWVRIYVPKGSTLGEFKGSQKKVQTYDELGKTVYEGFLEVRPLGKSTVTVTYTLPFKVKNEKEYKLLIQKQPGTVGHAYVTSINGAQWTNGPLTIDRLVKKP